MAKLLIGQTGDGKQFTLDPSRLTKHAVVSGATGLKDSIRLEDAPVLLPDLRSGRIRDSQSQVADQLSSWAAGTFRNKAVEGGSGS